VCVSEEQRYIDKRKWEIEEILLDIGGNGESNWDRMLKLVQSRVDEERDAIVQYLRGTDYSTVHDMDHLEADLKTNKHRRTK
jgi:hypothetical protein